LNLTQEGEIGVPWLSAEVNELDPLFRMNLVYSHTSCLVAGLEENTKGIRY
jgi:hypothetical protein